MPVERLCLMILLTIRGFAPVICPAGPKCKDSYKASWLDYPPYVSFVNGSVTGIIPSILQEMLESCCKKSINVTYDYQMKRRGDAVNQILNATTDIILPISGSLGKDTFFSFPFIGIVESPGVAFYTRAPDSPTDAIYRAIRTTWPLLLMILLLVTITGCLFWLLEFKFNREISPRGAVKKKVPTDGLFEAIWWAIVTMTTVGYGDVYAKSNSGRVLTIIWLLFGVVTCAIFTGIVTATLTSICLSNDIELRGSKVAVITDSEEYKMAVSSNAIPVGVSSLEDSTKKLASEHVDAILVDSYLAGQSQYLFKEHRLKAIYEKYFVYGLVLGANTAKYKHCLKEFVLSRQNLVFKSMAAFVIPLQVKKKDSAAEEKSRGMTDIKSKEIFIPFVVTIVLLVFLCLAGHVREISMRKKESNRTGSNNFPVSEQSLISLKKIHSSEIRKIISDLLIEMKSMKERCNNVVLQVEGKFSSFPCQNKDVDVNAL